MPEGGEIPLVENPLPTETDVRNFYSDILNFIKDNVVQVDLGEGYAKRIFSSKGFLFMHSRYRDYLPDEPITDSYQSSNITTEIVRKETRLNDENVEEEVERINHPGLLISTAEYPCSQKDKHDPSDIPPNTQVQISISGMREHFFIDGTFERSGLSSSGKPDEITPMKTEDFSKYKTYFDKAKLSPPPSPIFYQGK